MEWIEALKKSNSKSDVCRFMNLPINGTGMRKVSSKMEEFGITMDDFDTGANQRIYKLIIKDCPICGEKFETSEGSPKEKVTCSSGCANTHFRTGKNHGMWKGDSYRHVCFNHHKKECIICGEDKIVAVHHYNEDHSDDSPENLIPLCPTHHQYYHSKHKSLVNDKIEEYRNSWIGKALIKTEI